MPVIINDFQIEVEPAPAQQSRGGGGDSEGSGQPQQSPSVGPDEIVLVARLNRERMERVRAD